jgi:hypothetical protein
MTQVVVKFGPTFKQCPPHPQRLTHLLKHKLFKCMKDLRVSIQQIKARIVQMYERSESINSTIAWNEETCNGMT